jgi:hypothetical protein
MADVKPPTPLHCAEHGHRAASLIDSERWLSIARDRIRHLPPGELRAYAAIVSLQRVNVEACGACHACYLHLCMSDPDMVGLLADSEAVVDLSWDPFSQLSPKGGG